MGHGIRKDLVQRLVEADQQGTCLIAESPSDARRLQYACSRGDIVSPIRQVYALPELWDKLSAGKRELYKIRTLARLHPNWVFASHSAAIVHGLSVSYRQLGPVHLACTRHQNTRNRDGLVRHVLSNARTATINGICVTSVEQTAIDCMRASAFPQALAIADSALRVTGRTRQSFSDDLGTTCASTRDKLRAVEVVAHADPRAESGGESIARAIMMREGFMPPDLQVAVNDPLEAENCFFVDFYWELPNSCIAGELDGREKYYDPEMTHGRDIVEVLADERLRESRVCGTDVKVMRFSYANVTDTTFFRRLLTTYDIPQGYPVPPIALT